MHQPKRGEMTGGASPSSSLSPQIATRQNHDDFLDQMFSTGVPSWTDFSKSPWELTDPTAHIEDTILLANRLHQNQITSSGGGGSVAPESSSSAYLKSPQTGEMHNLMMMSLLTNDDSGMMQSPVPFPISVSNNNTFNPSPPGSDVLYTGFTASLPPPPPPPQQQQQQLISRQQRTSQSYGGNLQQQQQQQQHQPAALPRSVSSTGGVTAPPRHRVRARRGQATDPHSIAERLRRERIAERMKALQELVPNDNKSDKASMLDEIIEYVKFLQLQVKVLSMSRLGGAAAVAPLVAAGMCCSNVSNEGGGGGGGGMGTTSDNDESSLAVTEQQVAKLMEEDMGSAMQYLQGKGLCLMPISLASAISTATGHPRKMMTTTTAPMVATAAAEASPVAIRHQLDLTSSSSLSVLTTVQSADKNNASISKP